MKIIQLQAENFKKLKAIEIRPTGPVVEITGKCEQGKTTVLDAIKAALCGEKFDEPVRKGQEKGKVVVDLGDKVVTRTFTASGGSLKVESKDGAKYPSPQALLDKLVGKIAFNPLEFARADAKKQVEMLLAVVDIKVDAAKLKEISGVVVPAMPNPLDMLNTAYKTVFENRTLANRQLDAAEKIVASMPAVAEVEPVSVAALVVEKDAVEKLNRWNEEQRQAAARIIGEVKAYACEGIKIQSEIDDLLEKLGKAKQRQEINAADEKAAQKRYNAAKKDADALKDADAAPIKARIADADNVNRQAKQFTDRAEKSKEVARYQSEADALTAQIEAIKKYKTEIIKATKFPVDGLDFAAGAVTYQGLPFSQASGAQRMRVGIAIGMAANPELRVIMLDGYESLDCDQRAIVEQLAQEHDFQVWATSVSSDGTVGIYIEDGEIK